MKIIDIFKTKKPVISLEVFPPKPDTPLENIFDTLDKLNTISPDFISVTYGASGSNKTRTVEIASRIKNQCLVESMAHFTCIGHLKDDIDKMLIKLKENKLENILALRGDIPKNIENYNPNTYKNASDLIQYIKNTSKDDFCIAAAAYAEGHPDSIRIKQDLNHLKEKVDIGVDFLITQLFFDNRIFYDFLDRLGTLNINCPISAGIMPIFSASQIKKISALCGASIPAKLILIIDKYQNNPDDMLKAGIEYATTQIKDLIENGIDGIHLFTMNQAAPSIEILKNSQAI